MTRQVQILELINHEGRQNLQALAQRFGVSVQTIRYDVRRLSQLGLVLRNHGEVLPFPNRENISFNQRRIRNTEGKRLIARCCAEKIGDFRSVMLGTGSTIELLAQELSQHHGLTVMTNNLHAAKHLCDNEDGMLMIAGGQVRKRDQDLIGGEAYRFFNQYWAEIGVVSVGAMDRDGALYDFNDGEVMAREALLARCQQRILLIDNQKFDSQALCSAGDLRDYSTVITDQPLETLLQSRLHSVGVSVITASPIK